MNAQQIVLEPGMRAPDFTLPAQTRAAVTLTALRGSRVVLFAYPRALTPGCTREAADFQAATALLKQAGYTVLGISPDSIDRLTRFAASEGITYPLLSDTDHQVLRAYGAYGEKKNYGRMVTGVIRSTFAIDTEGVLTHALYNVKATGHVPRLLALLGVEQ